MRHAALAVLALVALAPAPAPAEDLPTFPVEWTAGRAELIVVATRGERRGVALEVTVTRVIHGPQHWKGKTIAVEGLVWYPTRFGAAPSDGGRRRWEPSGVDLRDRPLVLFLSRAGVADADKSPATFGIDATGGGSAVKLLDGGDAYGYYQKVNPGWYSLAKERVGSEELFRRIEQGLELAPRWQQVTAITDPQTREKAALDLLKDRDLPAYYTGAACRLAAGPGLLEVVRDEVENVAEPGPGERAAAHFVAEGVFDADAGETRLSHALAHVRDGDGALLPLLERVRDQRPSHYPEAVRCAARACGPEAAPFLARAIAEDVAAGAAADGLRRLKTAGARDALLDVLRAGVRESGEGSLPATLVLAELWPDAWKQFAAEVGREPGGAKAAGYVDGSWRALVEAGVFPVRQTPAKYWQHIEPSVQHLASGNFRRRTTAAGELRKLLQEPAQAPFARRLLEEAAAGADSLELRTQAAELLK